jgi:uncharacterized protein (DUF433 family)
MLRLESGGALAPTEPETIMVEDLLDRIDINPQVMLGKPVIRGTRITVEILLEKMAAGCSMDEILADYPRLSRDDVLAAVAYARDAISTDEIILRIQTGR